MLTFFLRGVGKKSLLIFWNSVFERVENIEKKGAKKKIRGEQKDAYFVDKIFVSVCIPTIVDFGFFG